MFIVAEFETCNFLLSESAWIIDPQADFAETAWPLSQKGAWYIHCVFCVFNFHVS